MKKNLLNSVAVAAMSLLALACAKEQVTGDGQTVEATFEVDVPGMEVSTKGLSDAASVDELVFDAFRKWNDSSPIEGLRQKVKVENGKANIVVKLVKGQNYCFVFWAQKSNNGYYNTDNLTNITVDYSNALANDSSADAFFATESARNVQAPVSKTIILKRPFAQVNYVTKEDLGEGLHIEKSQVTVKNALTSFNPLNNRLSGMQDVTFNYNAVPTEKLFINGDYYSCLATAFVFAKTDKTILDVEAKFKANTGYSVTVPTPGLPCQRNYRTNVIGDFMTVEGAYNVEIDSDFNGDFQEDYIDIANALSSGQDVTLAENYLLEEGNSGVTVNIGKTSVLNLNGKKFSNENAVTTNKAALQVHGDLTINGDGEVYCAGGADNNAIIVEQGGKLVINGGTYNVGKDKNGKSNATIYVNGPDHYGRNGSVEINGGVFMNEEGSNGHAFVLNQNDDITVNCFSVKGGTFVGFNPASVNEAHGAITSFVADGYRSVETTYEGKQAWEVVAIEPVGTQEDFKTALEAAAGQSSTIVLASNSTVTLDSGALNEKNANVTIIGDGTQTFDVITNAETAEGGKLNYQRGSSLMLKNVIVKGENANYRGVVCDELTLENCVVTGMFTLYSKAKFVNCTFNQDANNYNMWTYGSDVEYVGCTFNGKGKFLHVYNEGGQGKKTVKVENCTFNNDGAEGKPAINIKGTCPNNGAVLAFDVIIKDCTVTGAFPALGTGSISTNGGLWQVDNPVSDMQQNQVTVTVDDDVVYPVK